MLFYCGEHWIIRRLHGKFKKTQEIPLALPYVCPSLPTCAGGFDFGSAPADAHSPIHLIVTLLGKKPARLARGYSVFLATRNTSSIVVIPSNTFRMPSS
jgi:hypothetical protein